MSFAAQWDIAVCVAQSKYAPLTQHLKLSLDSEDDAHPARTRPRKPTILFMVRTLRNVGFISLA